MQASKNEHFQPPPRCPTIEERASKMVERPGAVGTAAAPTLARVTTTTATPKRRPGPVPPAERPRQETSTESDEPFVGSANEEYETYAESSIKALPPSIRPPTEASGDPVEVKAR